MTKEFFGIGSHKELQKVLLQEKPRKIFLVVGKEAYEKSGVQAAFSPMLKGFEVLEFSEFEENPKIEDVQKGIAAFRSFQPDLVLACGGGSALDMAKSINALAVQEGDPLDFVLKKKEITHQSKPLVAVPTTAGTGAEATHFAVVYMGKIKYSLAHRFILPTYSIVDPQFTFSLPAKITASTGMDALAQAIESFWSNKSTEESKAYAREAILLILPNLAAAVNTPTPEARGAMSKGAHLAGKAINISFTTACHAISYPLTSYFGVPHGHAVALTLPSMILFNSEADEQSLNDSRGVVYVKKAMAELVNLFGARDGREAKEKLEQLMDEIHLERRLSRLGVRAEEDVNLIVENGFNPERVKNNPRILTIEALRLILKEIT
ncbi:MAG: phosphonoacetaldehyde reductase [Parcubacteria group bacterium]|nr:phosphonoacetaldehyde reductase [Parcubacteria group bacterium]